MSDSKVATRTESRPLPFPSVKQGREGKGKETMSAQIASAVQDGSTIRLYDETGHHYTSICTGQGDPNARMIGYTSNSVSFYDGNGWVYVYDATGRQISGHPARM